MTRSGDASFSTRPFLSSSAGFAPTATVVKGVKAISLLGGRDEDEGKERAEEEPDVLLTSSTSAIEHLKRSAATFADELLTSGEGDASVSKVALLPIRVLKTRTDGTKDGETTSSEEEEGEEHSVPVYCVKVPGINLFKSQSLLSKEECERIKDVVLRIGDSEGFGSYRYAKQTLHCNEHETLKKVVQDVTAKANLILNKLFDDQSWGEGVFTLTKSDEPHVVVYDTTKTMKASKTFFTEVEFHTDNSTLTWIIALSDDATEYRGGGTFFEDGARLVTMQQGQGIFFPGGSMRHRGEAITEGRRLLLIGFLDKKPPHHESESRPSSM